MWKFAAGANDAYSLLNDGVCSDVFVSFHWLYTTNFMDIISESG